MAGSRAFRFIQLGKETTPGTSVAATTIWRGQGAPLDDRQLQLPDEDIGIFGGADRGYFPEIGAVIEFASIPLTFQQLPYILAAGIKNVVTGASDGAGTDKLYSYPMPTTTANTITTYTIEGGDDQQEEEMEYSFVEEFTLSGKAGEAWMMGAKWRGRQLVPSTKTGALGVPTVEEALFQKTSLYIDAVGGTIGTTQKSNVLIAAEIKVKTGWVARWTADGNLYFSIPVMGQPDVELTITFLHDGTATAEKIAWRANTPRLLRLKTTGNTVATPGTAWSTTALQQDFAGKWISFDKLDEDTGNDIVKGTFKCRYNATAALPLASFLVVNELTALV